MTENEKPFQHKFKSTTLAHDGGHFVNFFVVNVLVCEVQMQMLLHTALTPCLKKLDPYD